MYTNPIPSLKTSKLKNLLIKCLLVLTTALPNLNAEEQKPNILVFLIDDMGLMDSSLPFLKGEDGKSKKHPLNSIYRTPNMERLAKRGTRFSQFYAMSVCSPTRISILTGQTSARHHSTQWIRSEGNNAGEFGPRNWKWEGPKSSDILLPKLFQSAGYRTIHSGKAHFGPLGVDAESPQNLGFDVNIAGCSWGQPGSYYGEKNYGNGIKRRQRRAVPGLKKYHGSKTHLSEALTLEINAEIEKSVKAKQPFFAYMAHYAVHTPFEPDPRFAKNYPSKNRAFTAYASLIEGIDKSLGDMMDHLEKLGVAENTLIIFLGDNGGDAPLGGIHSIASSAPLRGKKGTHYEGGMRVPFIAAWAKTNTQNINQSKRPIQIGGHSDQIGTVYDLFPTLLSFADIKIPTNHTVDGINLTSYFSDERKQTERDFLMHFPHSHRSSYYTVYRKGNDKVIWHYRHDLTNRPWRQAELFNLKKDPSESNNLAEKEPEKLKQMLDAMQQVLDQCEAQYPLMSDKKTQATLKNSSIKLTQSK